jgi:hypothetical protein
MGSRSSKDKSTLNTPIKKNTESKTLETKYDDIYILTEDEFKEKYAESLNWKINIKDDFILGLLFKLKSLEYDINMSYKMLKLHPNDERLKFVFKLYLETYKLIYDLIKSSKSDLFLKEKGILVESST